jgi:carbon-monoxide dehydrogenase medium subunit
MTVRSFELKEPPSLEAALDLLQQNPAARAIAGGTALLIMVKQGVYFPEMLVSLRKAGVSTSIAEEPSGLRIGAMATIHDLERSSLVRTHCPILAEAAHVVANIRIRNVATIGGNLAHADPQSDPPIALMALGAQLEIVSSAARQTVHISEFYKDAYETAIGPGELVQSIVVPSFVARGAYLKFTGRSSEDRPAAGVAALVQVQEGRCTDVRLVIGALTPTPHRLTTVEDLVRGRRVDQISLAEVDQAAQEAIDPPDDVRGSARFKRLLAGTLVVRALERCTTQGNGSET